jgi:uncharacterized protein (TIGR02246 family)
MNRSWPIISGSLLILAWHLLGPIEARTQEAQQSASDVSVQIEAEISGVREQFVRNYNAGDLESLINLYDEQARFVGTLQPFWLDGREAIADLWQRYFAAYSARRMIFRQPHVEAFGNDFTIETGYFEMYMQDKTGRLIPTYGRYSMVRRRTPEGWRILNMHVSQLPGTKWE